MRYIELNDHESIIEPDNRGRFNLRRYFGADSAVRYRAFVNEDRTMVTLERIEGGS